MRIATYSMCKGTSLFFFLKNKNLDAEVWLKKLNPRVAVISLKAPL
jgi:hypothetical protein